MAQLAPARVMAGSARTVTKSCMGLRSERRLPEFEIDWLPGYQGREASARRRQ